MPWPVYSERIMYRTPIAPFRDYRVPDDHRLIITDVTIVNSAANTAAVQIAAHGIYVYRAVLPALEDNIHYVTRVIVYQGELISTYSDGASLHCGIFGYILQDNTGRDGPPPSAPILRDELAGVDPLPADWHDLEAAG